MQAGPIQHCANSPNCTQANLQNYLIRKFKKESILEGKENHLNAGNVKAGVSQVFLVGKNLPAYAGDVRDMGSISGQRRSPRRGRGNPLQYSCLENPMDRGAWQATIDRVAKSWSCLKRLSSHAQKVGLLDHTWLITSGTFKDPY